MTSPRNRTRQTIKAEKAVTPAKSSLKSTKSNNSNRKLPSFLTKIKLRPLEKIGLGLLVIAIIYWLSTGKSTPEPKPNPSEQIAAPEVLEEKASTLRPLYITIDSLKLRAQPKLDSNFIRYLAFDETVYDMGEQTKNVQTIRYSADEIRTEPWVKIRTENGEIGWVFGAGVNFYRKKRKIGIPDSTANANLINTNTDPNSNATAVPATTPAATTAPATTTPTANTTAPASTTAAPNTNNTATNSTAPR